MTGVHRVNWLIDVVRAVEFMRHSRSFIQCVLCDRFTITALALSFFPGVYFPTRKYYIPATLLKQQLLTVSLLNSDYRTFRDQMWKRLS